MSRWLVVFAVLCFALVGLGPIAWMLAQVGMADLVKLLDARTLDLLGRTALLGAGASAVALALGVPFGFLVARTDLPGATALRALGVLPFLLPPLFIAITWTAMTSIRGAPATAWVLGMGCFPLVALFVAKAAERVDGRREEAALLAGGWRAVLCMEWRLLLPAAACGGCIAFVFAINDFAVPDYVSSVGRKFNVYADEVFANWQQHARTGRAVASSLPLLALTLALLLPALALRRRGALGTLDSGFRRPEPLRLGRARWPAFAFCLLVVLITGIAPVARLFWEAGGGARGFRLEGVRAALSSALANERVFVANSLAWSALAASLCVPLALVLGHALERSRAGRWLEWLVVLPLAVPAILFGIGEIGLWNRPLTAAVYEGPAMVVLLFAGRFAALPLLLASGAVASLDPRLEEAGAVAGAGSASRLLRIVAPSIRPALFGGWAITFVLAMRELDAAILVPSANGTVIFKAFQRIHFARDDAVAALCLLVVFFLVLPGLLWTLFARRRMEVLP